MVGAAVVDRGRVLAARRNGPEAARGLWELPGGKVEPGESLEAALVREVLEELDCEVRVTAVLPGAQPVRDGVVLRVALAELVSGEPVPREHDAVWWLRADELHRVRWLAPDVPFLDELRRRLAATPAVPA